MSRAPGLTISVSDGRVAVRAGDKLTYTVIVRNSGAVAVRRLKVTQTLSPGLEFISASDHGVAASGHVSWTASLPVGGKQTFLAVTRVTKTPPTLLRLAAVACVTLPGSSSPVVCAAHLDRLPAAAAAASSTSRSGHSVGSVLAYTAAGLGRAGTQPAYRHRRPPPGPSGAAAGLTGDASLTGMGRPASTGRPARAQTIRQEFDDADAAAQAIPARPRGR